MTVTTERPFQDRGASALGEAIVTTTPSAGWVSASGNVQAFTYRTALTRSRNGQRLTLPILVEVRRTETITTVAEPRSGIYGAGASVGDALDDFHQALVDFRDVLVRERELTPGLRDLLVRIAALV